mgnify:CR=1 FL=1
MIKIVLLLFGISFPLFGSADNGGPVGVWTGTLGSNQIVACFNGGDGSGYGSYYYKRFLTPIRLFIRDDPSVWYEDDTGIWSLGKPQNGTISGEWTNPKASTPKGKKTLPILLQKVDENESGRPACARDSYNLPLEQKPPTLTIGKTVKLSGGRAYRELQFAGKETIELIGAESGLPAINAALKLDQSAAAIKAYHEQRREFLGRAGYPAVDDDANRVDSWIGKLVTIVFITRPAGFGASSVSIDYRTWNVDSGEEADLWSWFGLKKWRLSPKFERLLLKNMATEECLSGLQYKSFNLAIEKAGFKFFSTGPSDECPDELRIPYAKAVTLMTPQGRQQFDAIIGK